MNFTHLHVHTEYSLLDGSNKIHEYVSRVKELGMNSAATVSYTHLVPSLNMESGVTEWKPVPSVLINRI